MDCLYTWQEVHNIKYNGDRFQVIQFGVDEDLNECRPLTANMEEVVTPMEVVKVLGVMFNDSGNVRGQLQKAFMKASRKAGWVLGTFVSRNP